jgi:hypothetical protein
VPKRLITVKGFDRTMLSSNGCGAASNTTASQKPVLKSTQRDKISWTPVAIGAADAAQQTTTAAIQAAFDALLIARRDPSNDF